jgi:GNAT superfamily N-acetyltransferase
MSIVFLADHPQWIPTIARWFWDEWEHLDPSGSLKSWIERLAAQAHRDRIPMTLVAVEKGDPIGTAQLVMYDMQTRKDFSPWLAGVFVLGAHRSRGVGSQLVRAATTEARRMAAGMLYLYTRNALPFYEKLGWHMMERCTYQGREVVIMC